MRPFLITVHPHGDRDIGFRVVAPNMLAHYYSSHYRSGVAITHCGIVARKDLLIEVENPMLCEYCQTIEDMRSSLDSTK